MRVVGSNPAPNTFFFLFFSSFFVFFSILRWFLVKSNPLHLHSPLFMILIIPNIVQNLYLHYQCLLFLVYIPHTPTSPTYPKPCYPTSPTPTPDRTPRPPPPYPDPPAPLNFFFFFLIFTTLLLRSHPP